MSTARVCEKATGIDSHNMVEIFMIHGENIENINRERAVSAIYSVNCAEGIKVFDALEHNSRR